jgi:AcrR family transcriptional regulator
MSPRSYQLGRRQAAADETRARIINAARELIAGGTSFTVFSMEAVARQADVARMTVYHQFGSKVGLLEALCDTLASSGGMEQLAEAFRRADPRDALDRYITVFARFWESDRLVLRRLRGLAALDPDFGQVIRARDERRREGLGVLVRRIVGQPQPQPETMALEEVVNMLYTLTSFECFETLAGPARSLEEVAPQVIRLAHAALDLNAIC